MTVADLLEQAKALSVGERKELVKLLIDSLDSNVTNTTTGETHSILELAGLGAEVWQGIDAQAYINQLRSEWDHRP
jgi:hypothetical protein